MRVPTVGAALADAELEEEELEDELDVEPPPPPPPPPPEAEGVGVGVGVGAIVGTGVGVAPGPGVGVAVGVGVAIGVGVGLARVTAIEAVLMFPAASLAVAVRACEPLETPVVFQVPEYGGVVSSMPRLEPSSFHWTPMTPVSSEAVADIWTEPDMVAPFRGAVMETEGKVMSGRGVVVGMGVAVGTGVGVAEGVGTGFEPVPVTPGASPPWL